MYKNWSLKESVHSCAPVKNEIGYVLWETFKLEWYHIFDRPFLFTFVYLVFKSHDYKVVINA